MKALLRAFTAMLIVMAAGLSGILSEVGAGHSSSPPATGPRPGVPLEHCRPLHLAAEPSKFRPGEAARRFTVFVESDCGRRSERVIVEVWYRALYYDHGHRIAFGVPHLVGAVDTRTEFAAARSPRGSDLKQFDIPANGWFLNLGCYIARVRITATTEVGRAGSEGPGQPVEQVGEVEACAVPPQPSLPGPSGHLLPDPTRK